MKILRRIVLVLVLVVVVGYLAALGVLYFKQRDFQYDNVGPMTALASLQLPNAEAVAIPTADNAAVNGWFDPPTAGKPVILFYKGNSGSFTEEHERYEAWVKDGYGFLAFDYRGFHPAAHPRRRAGGL